MAEVYVGMQRGGVSPRDGEGLRADVKGRDSDLRQLECQRDGDAAAAGADVQGACRAPRVPFFADDPSDEFFRFRPWHQDAGRHDEGATAEVGLPEDVLEGLSSQQPVHNIFKFLPFFY